MKHLKAALQLNISRSLFIRILKNYEGNAEYCKRDPCRCGNHEPLMLQKVDYHTVWIYFNSPKLNSEAKNFLLNDLSILLLTDNLSIEIATLCSPVLLDLLSRASDLTNDTVNKHEWIVICLSKLIWNFPDVARFTKEYFEKSPGFFCRFEEGGEPPSKKIKSEMPVAPSYKLLRAAHSFLIYDTETYRDLCDWSILISFLDHSEPKIRWFAYQCLGRIGNVKNINDLIKNKFKNEEYLMCIAEEQENQLWNFTHFRPFTVSNDPALPLVKLQKNDFCKEVAFVEGVLLNRKSNYDIHSSMEKFVYVPSVQKSLYRLALAVSAGEPILLQGPVGCGKTSFVEHLAAITGRRPYEELLKVQLGEHMDSKMLLGTHVCTEVPGEFVWKSGILIQAMTEGHWLLLEDIDCAPMDVISLLVPVLQSRSIALPGHANRIKAAAGFQLFATQRFIRGFEGSYFEFRSNTSVIENHFRKIMLEPLMKDELKKVICTKWPRLDKISEKILEIYSLFSADLSDQSEQCSVKEPLNLYSNHGRLVSTRDLFKFCGRLDTCIEKSKKDVNITAFQNAVDCFCDSIPSIEMRKSAAESFGNKLNVSTSKISSMWQQKPNIMKRPDSILIGRTSFEVHEDPMQIISKNQQPVFAFTRHSSVLLEKVAVASANKEPVLLVGETGTGKTSVVQYLAYLTKKKLTAINMSQQSDSVDLIGGYKPVDLFFAVTPIKDKVMSVLCGYTPLQADHSYKFKEHVSNLYFKKKYDLLAELMLFAIEKILGMLVEEPKKTPSSIQQISTLKTLREEIVTLKHQLKQSKSTLIFKFIEGALVKAMKKGEWLLLDEINLAEAETLECLAGILEKNDNTLFLFEKGSKERVKRHPDFRIFACMNPATDVGKKDLPVGIRNRFTEIFVDEIEDKQDLSILVQEYLKPLSLNASSIDSIVKFYMNIKKTASQNLTDGTGHYPHYSLRTLCRALKYASGNPCHNVERSLYEAFCLSFLSQLDNESHVAVKKEITDKLLAKNLSLVSNHRIPEPGNGKYMEISGYWIKNGNVECKVSDKYVFTETVERNLTDLARIVSASKYPVLLQGETSVGKTSLISWLAEATGNKCVRINNHEHTDIQEYIGTYSADATGKLVFKEGILAEAMRNGYWIILDELNLAPTEVMEALNRVLDDNRELFIPETQTLIKAHPGFMIFATQNPPGLYGGRKVLSRAFRNRFIELHFNEIPPSELEKILCKRCKLPLEYSKKLVAVMHDLQVLRRESGVFCGKQGFITLRDLFRWGERYEKTPEPQGGLDWLQLLADEGYLLLAGRVRVEEEIEIIQNMLKKHLKRDVDPDALFNLDENTSFATKDILTRVIHFSLSKSFRNVVWTYNMRRLAVLVGKAMEYKEPVLLIGTTGSGKTTICQMFSEIFGKKLHSVNCHMHSESADFLGGLRPVRDPDLRESKLFEWVDGPLVQAMKEGNFFLSDEISLADDSVLERLNSVLEPEQKILVPERSFDSSDDFEIIAQEGFQFFATMNPGGDYGKKELSPALRNRFTEIWCPSSMSLATDVLDIVEHNVTNKKIKFQQYASTITSGYGHAIAEFLEFFCTSECGQRVTLSIRDILTWVEFINMSQLQASKEKMTAAEAYLHGAFLAIIDGIGSGSSAIGNENFIFEIKKHCFNFLMNQVGDEEIRYSQLMMAELYEEEFEQITFFYSSKKCRFGLGPFTVDCGPNIDGDWEENYVLEATTPKSNAMKVLRAMQLAKPMLLEGSPGVGKTSLISILARATGHDVVRINLSEQTDISDLFGADLPVDGGENGEFEWRDGPFIQALKKGDWILLDELNLASQSVLEGLNACLDHRNQIYIPELGKTFHLDKTISRIFCCQNPQRQGGCRKGLPQSFLNRFTKVYMKSLEGSDMEFIATSVYRNINSELISAMVQFNNEIFNDTNINRSLGQKGAPWEFNLRDIFRWCDLMVANQSDSDYNIGEYMKLIYIDRMRTMEDREKIILKYEEVIKQCGLGPEQMVKNRCLKLNVYNNCVQLGYAFLPSKGICYGGSTMTCVPSTQLPYLESLMKCIEMNWMAILVGPSGCGKSTLVHVLAELCGQELHVLSVNSEMDTIELLGGFEQADVNRKVEFLAQDLQPVFEQCVYECLLSESSDHEKRLQDLLYKHHIVRQAIFGGASMQKEGLIKKLNSLNELIKAMDFFELEEMSSVVLSCKRTISDLIKKSQAAGSFRGGQFEWVDSMLINAATKGHWLLIDDANFCSSSVLDRLNAFLEPGGVLTINEQGIVGDELRTIVPHKDFRIILTLNPQNGEISRAMRNRGIEIFIGPNVCNTHPSKKLLSASLFAQCKGLIHNEMLVHFYFLYEKLNHCQDIEPPTISDFLSAVALCVQMIQKHGIAQKAFEDSCVAVFAERYLNVYSKSIALNLIRDEVQQIPNIKADYSIPITDFLPSSFDYRQSPLFSSLKKQASLYTLFFKDYLGKLFECAPFPENDQGTRSLFVCPPPQLFSSHQTIFHLNDIKVFTFVMKVAFESCPRQCFQYMIFFIWYWVTSNFPNLMESDKEQVKIFHHYVKKYQAMMREFDEDSLMRKLVDSAMCMFNEVGYTEISSNEVPFDLRWNQYVYQKVLIQLRQKHEDPDSVEYELNSRANRCSLLLHFKSLKFTSEIPSVQNCRNLATCAAEAAKNPNAFKDSNLLPLAYLPRFVEELETSILKFMNDESMPCSDEYYWKLFDIILYYHGFQRVYTSHAEKGMDCHMKLIALNASWLLKKFRNLYQGICNMPTAFSKAAADIETNLACNTPVQKFRHKCMKLLGRPLYLPDERTADFCRLVAEIFQPLDLIDLVKSPQTRVNDFKIILKNLKPWMTGLGDSTFTSLYEKDCRKVFSSLHQVRAQMVDVGIIQTDDDDIMDIVEKPAELPTISNTELALDVQMFPLWDFLFVTYEAEVLSKNTILTNQMSDPEIKDIPEAFIEWGTQILALNPIHLTHLIAVVQCDYQASLTPALVYFFRHTRHGFSSDGLTALNFEVKNSRIEIRPDMNKYWQYRYNWANQYPLLTHIFASLFEKSADSSLLCPFPLGSYSEKINQLKKAQAIIWKHFDRFASPTETFRRYSASIITSWFSKLLTAMASLDQEVKPTEIDIFKLDKTDILKLIEQWKIMPIIKTEGNDNILFLATENVIELQAKLNERIEDSKLQWVTGKASTLVGLLTSVLLMPRDYLDPGMKVKIKLCTYQEIILNLRIEREMRKWVNDITCGQSLGSEWIAEHPHIQGLKDLFLSYEKRTAEIEKKTPFRPHEELFYSMQNDMGYYVKNLGNPDMIIDIITKLNIVNNMTDENDLSQCDLNPVLIIQKAQKISENLENFVDRMLKKYSVYPDIIYPFLVGVEQIIFGLSMSCNSVIIKEAVNIDPPQKLQHLNELLSLYTSFSRNNYMSPLQMASTILNASAFANLNTVLSLTKDYYPNTGRLVYKMVKSAILELSNEIKFQKYHPESKLIEIKELLFSAFQYLYKAWQVQDEIKKKKKAEEEALFKTVHHEDEMSDEDKLNKELKEMFPFYDEEFSDLVKKDVDSDGSENKAKCSSHRSSHLDYNYDGSMLFSDQDMFEVCQLHATAMSLLANVKPHENDIYVNKSTDLDILTPILQRHEVMSCVIKTLGHRLDSTLEKTMIREQLLLCQELQKLRGKEEDNYYDIYHDPNPSKVVTINPLLKKLVNHVNVLLEEFPENPNLIEILIVTERVLSFPVSDPVMKFVAGLELVLETAQHWEQNAHSKVSIRPEMEEITQKIIEYRAMELNMWKKGLQNIIKKQYVKSSKWWFFMFPLFYTDNTYAESEKAVIKKGLQQCLDDSPIGEFPARLSILRTFLQEFNVGSSTEQSRSYANILFNIYTYYEQFLPAIEKEIALLRKPVEKDLKDYVKIARWNDLNFYAVKASVEKSHRTVLKHVKAFETALQKVARTVFILPSKNVDDNQKPWYLDIKKEDYIYRVPKVRTEYFRKRNEPFFQKFPKYQKKVIKIAKGIGENFPVAGYVNTLNDFCGNIIEALESATIEGQKAVCTRSREKKQALNKIENKKRLLATLFKNLKSIGLSYRQGMMRYYEDRVTELMSLPAFDISKMKVLKSDPSFGELLSKSSSDTNHYFYKSLAQYAQLQRLMESPSKDITLDIMHRIQGYGGHLLTLVSSQRIHLVKLLKDIDNFGCFVSLLSTVYKKQDAAFDKNFTIIPPQKYFKESNLEMSNFMEIISLTVNKFGALLDCAPQSSLFSNENSAKEERKLEKKLSSFVKEDNRWSVIKLAVINFNSEINNLLGQLSELKFSDNIVSWDRLRTFSAICQSAQKAMETLMTEMAQHYNTDCLMLENLVDIHNNIVKKKVSAQEEEEKIIDSQMDEHETVEESEQSRTVAKLCQKLATQVTLGIQEMFVFSTSFVEDKSENVVPDNLFTIKITESLTTAKNNLRFDKILKIMKRLKVHFKSFQNSTEGLLANDNSFRLLANLAPVLNQYYQLIKVHLAISLGMHRTSSKFLTILLEIFSILAMKGFCIPSDLQEEAAKAGATKFEDIEDGGFGEGEGTKDVSSKLESEDQLDEAMKEGEEKKKNDESDDKDLKDEKDGVEMSDDFEGKLHSGEGTEENSDDEDETEEPEDLDKQMGEVESEEAEKLDDKVWGSDSENEEDDLRDEDGTGGVTDHMASELVAKDNKPKEDSDGDVSEKENQPQDASFDELNEEYEGEKPDPMINAPPSEEPEIEELPDNMEITEEVDKDAEGENLQEMTETDDDLNEPENEPEEDKDAEGAKEDVNDTLQEDTTEEENESGNVADQEETEQPVDESTESNEYILPTETPTTEDRALPSSELKKSSSDPVQTDEDMDWEAGAQSGEEQHKEGLSEAKNTPSEDAGHEGKRSSARRREAEESKQPTKLKPPSDNRSVDESAEEHNARKRPVMDKKSKSSEKSEEIGDTAEVYEHITKEEESKTQAIDIANKEQAEIRTAENESDDNDYEEEIIDLSSDEEEPCNKSVGESLKTSQSHKKPGERGEEEEDEMEDIPDGIVVQTHSVIRGTESTFHTQNEVWRAMSWQIETTQRFRHTENVNMNVDKTKWSINEEVWRKQEMTVLRYAQELCEQLRLVLEPTKMSKFKGDYRTGKRLNMRKIIPYIASQFRKDKIWLRRTKPSKRQYQIMLAVDDSKSMGYNKVKQLAFESLAILGQSLTLLEAGELSVVSFGEKVELLHGFQDQFSSNTGARILEQVTFSQNKTNIAQLLDYATDVMVQARQSTRQSSKETAQLLIIISDGRTIYAEGMKRVKTAVKNARDNNIFMVYLVLDNVEENKSSVLDGKYHLVEGENVKTVPYMDMFPFPFYIILREISALSQVLGEALRQWFELVTSVDR